MILRRTFLILIAASLGASAGCGESHMRGPLAPDSMPWSPGYSGNAGSMIVAGEFDYLARMIPHHEEAIAAARLLRAGTARQEMRDFADTIIRTQSAEVVQMRTWLAQWYPGRDPSVAYQPMMRDLTGLTAGALDRAFLEDMIPHHMMAVAMSQQLLARNPIAHPAVVPFAAGIRDTQRAEIQMMGVWLRVWFGV